MDPQQVPRERWNNEGDERKGLFSVQKGRVPAGEGHITGQDSSACSAEDPAALPRPWQQTVSQRRQAQPQLRLRMKPQETSVRSGRLERLPLQLSPETRSHGCEHSSKAQARPSVWTNLLIHARRSLPFLGGDGLEGPLPPTPKAAVYDGRDIHQLGSSLLSLIPTAWDAVHSNCWRQTHVTSEAYHSSAVLNRSLEYKERPGSSTLYSSFRGGRSSAREARQYQECIAAVDRDNISGSPCGQVKPEEKTKWRSRRVPFDASDLTTLLMQCLRRRLSATAAVCVAVAFSLLLLYCSLASLMCFLTEALAEYSKHLAEAANSTWANGSQSPVGELASPASVQLQQDLYNLRLQVQEELKALQDYREQLHLDLRTETIDVGHLKDGVCPHGRQAAQLTGRGEEARETASERNAGKSHGEVERGWEEPFHALKAQVNALIRNDARISADVDGLKKRFEETSISHGARDTGATLEELRVETERMVKKFHSFLDEDERIDWALESLGASIVLSETVPSLAHTALSWSSKISSYLEELVEHDHQAAIGGGGGRFTKKPNIMLQPDTHPGNCFPFYGDKGNVTIMLPTTIFVTSVAVDGVATKHFTASTPRKFTLWGYEDSRATPVLQGSALQSGHTAMPGRLPRTCRGSESSGRCTLVDAYVEPPLRLPLSSGGSWWGSARRALHWMYLLLKDPVRAGREWGSSPAPARRLRKVHLGDYELRKPQRLSVFELQKKYHVPVRKVTFEFQSNFGHPYTCVYRLRVHGDKGASSAVPLPSRSTK